MKDGLSTVEFITETASGTSASFTTISGTETVVNAELGTGACSGTKVSSEYPVMYTGSPIKGNTAMQYGSWTATSDSGLTVVFAKPFAAAPKMIIGTTSGAQAYTSVIGTGSFVGIVPAGSNTTISYLAIGSGRI
jgi:hypothetical protein